MSSPSLRSGSDQERPGPSWHALGPEAVLDSLSSGADGLGAEDAARRLAEVGPNVLPRPRAPGVVAIYLRQFVNPLVYLLVAATLVSLAVGEAADALFIFVVLQFNAAIGTLQEWKAQASAEALDKLIANSAVVLRDGQRIKIDAAELVPGDVVVLDSGTRVTADLRLLEARELTLDESLLTGESTPVTKDPAAACPPDAPLAERRTMLYAGTTVLLGRAQGVVAATAGETEIGRIAETLGQPDAEPPPLVRRLARFSRVVGIATVVLIALLAVAQILQGTPLVTVFLVAVALAVAAIPEGLPVAITVALAIATSRMGARRVIVRALPAVEGLGACTVIASDKTGTLTCNALTVKRIELFRGGPGRTVAEIGGEGYQPRGAVTVAGNDPSAQEEEALRRLAASAALCNEASLRLTEGGAEWLGDTVDVAFLALAAKLGLRREDLEAEATQVGMIPYEPQRRFAASFTLDGGETAEAHAEAHVKGAAEVVLPMCGGENRDAILAAADRLAADGYRVLAVARGPAALEQARAGAAEALSGLELLGLVGLIDPVRPEVPAAVATCREAGISVRMITGDHPQTALAIARQLDIARHPSQVVTGAALAAVADQREAFDRLVRDGQVFARVEPVQKLDIVQSLQRGGHFVAVTGDGVNDAPALTAAHIGVAMGKGGTDVARQAADLIIADDNFASIVGGVEEGRVAYDNVRKLIYLLIATGLGEIVLFLLAILSGLPAPLTAVQLLWLNLVTNGIQDIALAFERGEPGILGRKPRPPGESLFDRTMVIQVAVAGVTMGVIAFAFYGWCLAQGLDHETARNLVLLLMVLFENAHALNARSETRSVFQVPARANRFLIVAILSAQALHISALYLPGLSDVLGTSPVGPLDWVMVAALAASLIVVMETYKRLRAKRDGVNDASGEGRKN